jgi:SAM-dependent methyltransferase
MGKLDEVAYFKNIGEAGRQHAANKPFSDPQCGTYLLDMGMVFSLLPPPPARILDLGVGTGWTSVFLAKRGHEVIGQDISEEGISLAFQNKAKAELTNLDFIVSDYENLRFDQEFDAALFYDCLHHAEDAEQALASVFRALKPQGLCITIEPGKGHGSTELSAVVKKEWGVTEKDMPPKTIARIARKVGFRGSQVYLRVPRPIALPSPFSLLGHLQTLRVFTRWFPLASMNQSNIVVLTK